MSTPRSSPFRDGLQVSPERIARLTDAELGELMTELFRAQAHRCGSPQSEVRVNTEEKAKDGGCDGWTSKPVTKDDWLGDADTCWQLKAGTSGTPARLKNEVGKPLPKETLDAGGRFVVVASGSTNGKRGEDDRLKTLTKEAAAAGIPKDKIYVIGSERLAIWCNQNPAVAARWAGMPYGLWRLSDWANAEVHQVPWQAPDSINEEIARQRSGLEFETGSVQHLHIYGPPGVGKTRFALEICREAPWSASVIYVRQASDIRLIELIDGAVADSAVRLVVVADEIQPDQLRPLRDTVARADGRIRLITVGHCKTPEPNRIPALHVGPIDHEVAVKVVRGWYPSMPTEHVNFVVRFADGYVRLARLAADAIARDPALDVHGLLSRHEIRGFLDGMLGTGDRRALHVVAVLESVGWTDDIQIEGETIACHFGLDWNDVRAKVEDFDRRLGIVPRGGRYRYISPTPLGIHLAVEAWTTFPELLRSLPNVLPTESAKSAYYDRLRSMASNHQAREYAREQLAFFFRLIDFVDARAVQRWSALSAANPSLAAANILRALENADPGERFKIADHARRETVWTLVRLSWHTDAFYNATKALALLAEAENEPWSNNATSEFLGRFQIFLGGTALPYLYRLVLIDELVASNRVFLVRLAVKALVRVGERQGMRVMCEPASDQLPEKEWQPSTEREHLDCVFAAIERLTELAARGSSELESDFVTAAKDLAPVLLDGHARHHVAKLFNTIRAAYPEAREPLRRAIAEVIYRERKYWKQLPEEDVAELDVLHSSFEDASLLARLQQLLAQSPWDHEEQLDLQPLADELAQSPSALTDIWPWLTSGDVQDGWRFGEALADSDIDSQLLEIMLNAKTDGTDFLVLCGYVHGAKKRRGDDWYNDWVEALSHRRPRPLRMLFEVARRCGVTPQVARNVQDALQAEPVPPDIVGQLGFGRWADELDPDLLAGLLRAMIDAGHVDTALLILQHRIESLPEEHGNWLGLALELIATPSLIRSHHLTNYHWTKLALRYVGEQADVIAEAIFRQQSDRSAGIWSSKRTGAEQVLEACVDSSPETIWSLLETHLSRQVSGYMFSFGLPRSIIDRMPADQVIAWLDADPDGRASILAKLVDINFMTDETLAARIVGAYGDRDEVAGAFFAEYLSGTWWGPASTHWKELAASIREVAHGTTLPKLRKWAEMACKDLQQMAERDCQREAEDKLRES